MERTKYARSGDVSIAYQVVGDGPPLVFVPGWISHLEYMWEDPTMAPVLRRLASFCRLILLDRRGTGLSDRDIGLPSIEQRMDDVRAVLDAAGVERAALFGVSEGGPMCTTFAATYPARTTALVLYGTFARIEAADDYPVGLAPAGIDRFIAQMHERWGEGVSAQMFAPSRAHDDAFRAAWGRLERVSVSPAGIRRMLGILRSTDVRHILPVVRVPTLVLHREGDRAIPIAMGRYLADRIPGARFVALPGDDHAPQAGDADALLGEVEEFVTGARHQVTGERVLATVLFTDIVGSTERAATLGDTRWRELLEAHHGLVRRELRRYRGREIDTAGDGFLAAFDGPARAIQCARAIREAVRALQLEVRVGVHCGECEVVGDKLGGIAVHVGARIVGLAVPGEVLVSGTVKDLVAGSGLRFESRGMHGLKGIPGEWPLYRVAA